MGHALLGASHRQLQFEEIYRTHWRGIYNYVYGRLLRAEEAEEVTADVFFAAWEHLDDYDAERARLSTWLGRIAHNKVNDFLRKAYRMREISVDAFPESMQPTAPPAEEGSLRDPVTDTVERILRLLSEEERNLLELRYALDLSNDEVASILDVSANAVSHRYGRLLEKCKKLFV